MSHQSSTIVSVSPQGNASNILVEAYYASGLYQYLQENGFSCHPPEDAIFRSLRVYRKSDGSIEHESEVLDKSFKVNASSKDLELAIGKWLETLQQ